MVGLQRACFPAPFPEDLLWTPAHLESHRGLFPEGQWVAEIDGQIVGSASSAVVSEETWLAHLPWEQTLGGFDFSGHQPEGTTLYGADISVRPEFRGRGIARLLYEERFQLVRRLGLRRYGTACRIPDCQAWVGQHDATVEAYVQAVLTGQTQDRTLTPLLRLGLSILDVLHGYMADEESMDAAVLLQWENPDFKSS